MRSSKKRVVVESIGNMEKIEKIDNKAFKIDKRAEDKAVIYYQQTGDVNVLEKLYEARIPSLQFWASRYYFLMDNSTEDMFAEFRGQFMKAIVYFDKKRGHFNTCLYTFIRNCINNIITGKNARKRRPEGIPFDFNNSFVVSLDKPRDGKDGSVNTLMDVIANQLEDCAMAPDKIELSETIGILSRDDERMRGYLKKISYGVTLANLIKECKTVTGCVHVNKKQSKHLKSKSGIVKLIRVNNNIEDSFKLLNYEICEPLRVNYKIEMKKSKEADLFLKKLRRLRKNSEWYIDAVRN